MRRKFEYRRNGPAVLFAGHKVHEGDVAAWVTDSTRTENFVDFLADLDDQTPAGTQLHCVDNLSAHFTPKVEAFLDDHPRIFLHNTPTHASWLTRWSCSSPYRRAPRLRNGEFAGPTTAAR